MSFPAEILQAGIAIADTLTKGAQGNIVHEAFIGQNLEGDPVYAAGVTRQCVVDRTNRQIIGPSGQMVSIAATLTFVGDVAPNGAVTLPIRREPIDPRDKITLPDGLTGPIIDSPGAVTNPNTNRGFIQSIMIGAR